MGKIVSLWLEMPNQQKKSVRPSVCLSVCPSDNSSKSEPIWMNLFLKTSDGLSQAKFEDEQNRSSGSGDMGKKMVKFGCLRKYIASTRGVRRIEVTYRICI